MRKILSLCAAMLVAFAVNAAVVNITPDGATDLRHAVRDVAAAGDTIVLADGVYAQGGDYTIFNKNLVVKAADGAAPVVKFSVPAQISSGATAEFIGIKFDMENLHGQSWYEHLIYSIDATAGNKLIFDGCEFYNDTLNNSTIYCSSSNKLDACIVKNCYFHDIRKSCLFFENADMASLTITNSTFANTYLKDGDASSYYAGNIDCRSTVAAVLVDHCTFYNIHVMNTDHAAVGKLKVSDAAVVSNCIFALSAPGTSNERALRDKINANNDLFFNYTTDGNWGTQSNVVRNAACVNDQDPKFVDAANGNFKLGEGSAALTMGTDGGAIGDPRWNAAPVLEPKTYYGAEGFLTDGDVIDPAVWVAAEWSITRNADKTLTFVVDFSEDITGLSPQINLGDYAAMTYASKEATFTTTATYEECAY